jgi:hypothetical protein
VSAIDNQIKTGALGEIVHFNGRYWSTTLQIRMRILGAARIADDGIVDPSRVLGHRLVAVAARDRPR